MPSHLSSCPFWEHRFFSGMESFPPSPSGDTPIFTDVSFDLLSEPNNLDARTISSFDDFLTGDFNLPDPPTDSSITPSETNHSSPRHSTRVKTLPNYLCKARTDLLWQKAMSKELPALSKTHTWDLVDLPPGKTVMGCKWVYKIKTKSDGFVERYKARLVAKRFSQEYGIDYEKMFAPVARLTSVRSLLVVACASSRIYCMFLITKTIFCA